MRKFIQAMIESEFETTLARLRYGRRATADGENGDGRRYPGHRHGHRSRSLMGTFGRVEIAVPRARLTASGVTIETTSSSIQTTSGRHLERCHPDC